MASGAPRAGLWSRAITARHLVIDPVDVLLDLAAAERSLWSWWAHQLGLPVEHVAATARNLPLREAVTDLRAQATAERATTVADEILQVQGRRSQLHRLVRRRRGAASLLRSIPASHVALWTTLDEDELAALEGRARLPLPPRRLCGLAVTDDERARDFLTDGGRAVTDWLAFESHPSGVERAERLGYPSVLVLPESTGGRARPGAASTTPHEDALVAEDPALLSVTPSSDGLTVGVRRQARLLP